MPPPLSISTDNRRWLAVLCVMLTVLSVGCARQDKVVPVNLIEQGPAGVLEMAAERAGTPYSMRITGTLQVRLEGGSRAAQGVILYAEPDSVRLDVTAFLGTTVMQAIISGRHARIYAPTEKVLLEGEFDSRSVISLAGFPFHPAMVLDWVLGPALSREWWLLADGADRFDLGVKEITLGSVEPGGHRLVVTLDRELFYRSVRYHDPRGRLLWESEYDDYRRVRGAWLPGLVTIRYPDEDLELTYEVSRRRANPDRSPGDFRLRIPPDVTRYPLVSEAIPPPGR